MAIASGRLSERCCKHMVASCCSCPKAAWYWEAEGPGPAKVRLEVSFLAEQYNSTLKFSLDRLFAHNDRSLKNMPDMLYALHLLNWYHP